MKIGWGWKIATMYGGFVAMIVVLVSASSRQKVDLVAKDYYKEEIKYQAVLDASSNHARLQGAFSIHASSSEVCIEFPAEFSDKVVTGSIKFYAPTNSRWDKTLNITTADNKMTISRTRLQRAKYLLKITYSVGGRDYYYESQIDLYTL